MENSVIYETAKKLAEKLKQERPCYGGLEAAVIISDKGTHMGVTGVTVSGDELTDIPAETVCFLNMRNAGGHKASGLAVIKLEDMSFREPSAESMELMYRTSAENDSCLVCLGENESRLLSALRLGADCDSMMDGFDFDEPSAVRNVNVSAPDTTANVISGVAVEQNSPFYEKTEEVAPPEDTLSVMSEEQRQEPLKSRPPEPELTPEELLKQAKKRKSVAKSNFLFRKKHK